MINNKSLKSLYGNHPFYSNRLDTDSLFQLPAGNVSLQGNLNKAIRFIENYQLLSPELWAKFVTQFRNTTPKADDHDDGWRGEYWGKMMRGACFTYEYTQNPVLYDILCDTVRDMMSVQDENGRISSYSYEKQYRGWDIWSRKYVLLGMQYFIEICKDKKFIDEITDCMRLQVDYMISTLGYESEGKILITKATSHWKGMNSSSLLEPIVRLYNITKEQKYLDFASYIVDCGVISDENVNIFEMAYEDTLDPYQYPVVKAYEMMSCFEGLLEYYRVTKTEKWKTAIINFSKRVRNTDISVIGSAGCTHELFDHTLVRQTNTLYNGVLQETCVTVTWMKFCYQLLCITGDPAYADEIEKSTLNALIGAINFNKNESNGGLPFDSYSPLLFNTRLRGIGGKKVMADGSFYGCCACIGAAGTGLIGKASALLSQNGIAVNTFENGKISYPTPSGDNAELLIETSYPVSDTVKFTVNTDSSDAYEIAIRIPEWSKNTFASVNGEYNQTVCGEYARFNKTWKKGDYITLKFDMSCRVIKATADPKDKFSQYHVALKRGPIVLARDRRLDGDMESIVKFENTDTEAVPCTVSENAGFEHFYAFTVTDNNGYTFDMVDYSSAGRTWDESSMTTVWMPTLNYWAIDIEKPFRIVCPECWDISDSTYYLNQNKDGKICINSEKALTFVCEKAEGENNYFVKCSKKFLSLSEDGQSLTLSDIPQSFKIEHFAQNRFRIFDINGRSLVGSNNEITTPVITLAPRSILPNQVFRFEQI